MSDQTHLSTVIHTPLEELADPVVHHVFTDGSALGNPGPGGWGAIVVLRGDAVVELGGGSKHTTNNRMELTAAIESIKRLLHESGEIKIYTDSSYVLKGATEWLRGWKARHWMTAGKTPVENRPLWEEMDHVLTKRKDVGNISWNLVPGHVGVRGNERADIIATSFAAGEIPELFVGDLGDYAIDILDISIDDTASELRRASKARSRAKASSYLSMVDGVAKRHHTWAECEARVKGKGGAKYKKVIHPSEEVSILKSWGATLNR